jgi:hypothetical protein
VEISIINMGPINSRNFWFHGGFLLSLLFTHLLSAVFFNFSPNPGFMFQLHLFEAMGKKVDKSNSLYKQYNLQIIAKKVQETGE